MSPSAPKVQCPYCLGRRRVKQDGTMYAHDYGMPGRGKLCRGAGLTLEQAKAAKSEGLPPTVPSGRPDSMGQPALPPKPEDIF